MAFCENCGKQLEGGEKFCDGCGTAVSSGSQTQNYAPPAPAPTPISVPVNTILNKPLIMALTNFQRKTIRSSAVCEMPLRAE